jgi:hypothetical protein
MLLGLRLGDEHDEKKNRGKVRSLKKANRKVRKTQGLGTFQTYQERTGMGDKTSPNAEREASEQAF